MSTGEEDRVARSVALEKTYVHDVYDHMSALQYPEHRNTTPWPKVKRFLNDLEPGSIVCDVGCGNGKYLKVNPSIFKIGSDRCHKLTQIAKDDENEVLLCDNLTLPFRDETFDAVLSIAVIHHFATKERRVGALRELARVLRIGGRLMITVWAMEQKDRKFETQDVLVQWHHPQFYRSPSLEFSTTATTTSEEEFATPYRISQTQISDDTDSTFSRSSSLKQDSRPARSRLHLFQSLRSIKTSPSSSSLSSPNETCYSFVRKALQKLSRSSKKEKHHSRAWFLDSWASFGKDDHLPATRYDPEGCEENTDIQDLPIELRRMEKENESNAASVTAAAASASTSASASASAAAAFAATLTDGATSNTTAFSAVIAAAAAAATESSSTVQLLEMGLTQKSKSLNDILSQSTVPLPVITRSRSSIVTANGFKIKIKTTAAPKSNNDPNNGHQRQQSDSLKPKLVKQKKSICEEEFDQDEERDKATDMKRLVKELPMFKVSMEKPEKFNVLKQKSLTEDIMSADRLKEKEKVRQNIQKQASLNEELIYRRQRTLDSFKDTFLTSSSKKFQMFRSGLTSKLRSSTTNIEKVTGASIKSGFAKIFQGLTGGESASSPASDITHSQSSTPPPSAIRKSSSEDRGEDFAIERRCSHEENSDSSKDNSLQSDTSVDSEDSIISVIERVISKPDQITSPTKLTSPGPHSPKMVFSGGGLSHPSSPKIPQVMQYPNSKTKAFSLPASPRTLVLSPSMKQTFKMPSVAHISSNGSAAGAIAAAAAAAATTATTATTTTTVASVNATISTNGAILTSNGKVILSQIDGNGGGDSGGGSFTIHSESQSIDSITAASAAAAAAAATTTTTLKFSKEEEPVLKLDPIRRVIAAKLKSFSDKEMLLLSEKLTVLSSKETEPRGDDVCEGDESQKSTIEQPPSIHQAKAREKRPEEVSSLKTGSVGKSASGKRISANIQATYLTHQQSRLQSYELFNPEMEDIDTDSSGVSTPDSVGSVISVKMESSNGTPVAEVAHAEMKDREERRDDEFDETSKECSISSLPSTSKASIKLEKLILISDVAETRTEIKSVSSEDSSLLEAALFVASSLESTVDTALKRIRTTAGGQEEEEQQQEQHRQRQRQQEPERGRENSTCTSSTVTGPAAAAAAAAAAVSITVTSQRRSKEKFLKKYPSLSKSPEGETWDKECRQYIVDLAENLSERLLAEIDRYKEQSGSINVEREYASLSVTDVDDPYLTKLSEELHHVSKLTRELTEPETETETETETDKVPGESSEETTEIKKMDSIEEISDDLIMEEKEEGETEQEKLEEIRASTAAAALVRSEKIKVPLMSEVSTDTDSPSGSIKGWLDSRRNTIESGGSGNGDFGKALEPLTTEITMAKEDEETVMNISDTDGELYRLSVASVPTAMERVRKLSKSETASQTRLSIESTDTIDVSERTASSSEDSISKRDTTQTETSSGLSIESDLCELDKSGDNSSKSADYRQEAGSSGGSGCGCGGVSVGIGGGSGGGGGGGGEIKYSGSQMSLLRPGESIESSDAGDISERTGSVSDFSRQNTESRSVITQSSASLASWSDCSKDIRFADRRTARCDGRSSSEETNPRAMLTRQQAAIQEPSEIKVESTDTSLSGSTSQDSLTSESGGGSIMFHRYYHVFREGELDALMEEFVENLHIISSYYDHTNWCIIAEKVRVWTI